MRQDLPGPEKQTAPYLVHPSRRRADEIRLPRIARQIRSFIKNGRAGSAIRRRLKREAGRLPSVKTALATLGLWFLIPGISSANAEIAGPFQNPDRKHSSGAAHAEYTDRRKRELYRPSVSPYQRRAPAL